MKLHADSTIVIFVMGEGMKKSIHKFAVFLLFANASSYAAEGGEASDVCTTEGYYMSSPDSLFMGSLANRFATKMNVSCLDNNRDAYFLGKETAGLVFNGGSGFDVKNLTPAQKRAFDKAVEFQNKVNDFILSGVKGDL